MNVANIEKKCSSLTLAIRSFPALGIAQLVSVNSILPTNNESPPIKLYCKNGQYRLEIDGGDKVVDPAYISDEFKKFLSGGTAYDKAKKIFSLMMPSKADLSRRDRYMLFSSYNAEVSLRENLSAKSEMNLSKGFPRLPKEIYVELVRRYLREDGYPKWYLYFDKSL